MKALIEAEGDRILGFTAFGPDAGEVLGAIHVAMLADSPIRCCETPPSHIPR